MTKPLNIGIIGCGFMGRAHSNAYSQVNHFFPREHKPVLKACCARPEEKDKLEKFAKAWGYESMELDWKKLIARPDIDLIDVCVPNVLHHDIVLAAAKAGKMVVCEKPLAMNAQRGRGNGGGGGEGGRGEHGLVQLPPRAGHLAGQADHRRGAHRPAVPLSGRRTTRTTPSRPTCRRAAWPSGGSTPAWPAPA